MSQLNAGLVLPYAPAASLLKWIQDAEAAGVPSVWSTVSGVNPDIVTVFAAAAATTRSIGLGTAVVPIYPRHPAALASQVVAIEGLAPGRLKLGVGTSHKPNIEGALGLRMGKPLHYLREYVAVLRDLLWNGTTKASGEYLNVALDLPSFQRPTSTPILVSALGEKAFRTAGEIADGAISWVSPIPYLVRTALPAVQAGAAGAGRPVPPIVGHVPVAVTTDRDAARAAGKATFGGYGAYPNYANMFGAAGYPVGEDGRVSDSAIDELVVSGSSDEIRARLERIQGEGIGELLVSHVIVNDADAEREELNRILAGNLQRFARRLSDG